MKTSITFLLFTLLLCVSVALAQDTCPDIVQTALQSADSLCQSTTRNQACYGNFALTAEAQPGVANFTFNKAGDITDVANISKLKLQPMDTATNTWGLVIMQLQADLPDTMPGQNVTFVLFGNVELQNAAQSGQNPMQAFYLQSGVGDAPCAEAPSSGLLVQTPQGVGQVQFTMNGVDVQMGSTVFMESSPGDKMLVRTLEGSASLEIDGDIYPIVQGTEYVAPIDENYTIDTGEATLENYSDDTVSGMPLNLLEREIEPVTMTDEQFDAVYNDIVDGNPLCSDDAGSVRPSCDDVAPDFGGSACVYQPEANAPLCEEANPCTYLPADVADACKANLQEGIDSGAINGDTIIDFGDPCAIVPTDFAETCKSGVEQAETDGPILKDPTETPDETDSGSNTGGGDTGSNGGNSDNGGNSGGDDSGGDNSGGGGNDSGGHGGDSGGGDTGGDG